MEMTENQDMTLALMTVAFIAFAASKIICPRPLYRALSQSFLHCSVPNVHLRTDLGDSVVLTAKEK